mgnify:CR=1 FL=1
MFAFISYQAQKVGVDVKAQVVLERRDFSPYPNSVRSLKQVEGAERRWQRPSPPVIATYMDVAYLLLIEAQLIKDDGIVRQISNQTTNVSSLQFFEAVSLGRDTWLSNALDASSYQITRFFHHIQPIS